MQSSYRSTGVAQVGAILAVQTAVAGACIVLLSAGWGDASGDHVWSLSVAFTVLAAWSFLSWRILSGEAVGAYPAFLLSFVLFSGGQLVLHAVGAMPGQPLGELFSAVTIERSALLVAASLALLHLGALLRAATSSRASEAPARVFNGRRLRAFGIWFVVLGLPATILDTAAAVRTVLAGGYGAIYDQSMRTGMGNLSGFLSLFLIPGLLIVLGTRPSSRWNVRLSWSIALIRAASLLFIGQRGYAVMTLVPMLMLHDRLVHRVRRTFVVGAAAAAVLVAFPLIRAVRTLDAQERLMAVRSGVQVEDPLTNTISEMGGSMRTLAHTIELVPASRPYDHGLGLLRAASTVVPNLFWERHPGAVSYAEWLTRTVAPWQADVGGGLGYSLVAEGFINFGVVGGPLYCGAIGFLLAWLLLGSRRGAPEAAVLGAVILSVVLFLPRSELSSAARSIVWCAVLPYFLASSRRRRPRATAPALQQS